MAYNRGTFATRVVETKGKNVKLSIEAKGGFVTAYNRIGSHDMNNSTYAPPAYLELSLPDVESRIL